MLHGDRRSPSLSTSKQLLKLTKKHARIKKRVLTTSVLPPLGHVILQLCWNLISCQSLHPDNLIQNHKSRNAGSKIFIYYKSPASEQILPNICPNGVLYFGPVLSLCCLIDRRYSLLAWEFFDTFALSCASTPTVPL